MELACELRILGCPHQDQPMFATEYKRSNRTRMAKILRCFPHCCPTHRPRSYCGSALHVQVTIHDKSTHTEAPDAAMDDDDERPATWVLDDLALAAPLELLHELVVYGRFEIHDPDDPLTTGLRIGERLPATHVQQSRQRDVIWVPGPEVNPESVAVHAPQAMPPHSRIFVLNQGDGESHHWEYDWKSGTSQRKRACQHQFRAYVFRPDRSDPTTWEVVGMAASTPFTLSSYRKIDDDEQEAMEAAPAVVPAPPSAHGSHSVMTGFAPATSALPPTTLPPHSASIPHDSPVGPSPVFPDPRNEVLLTHRHQPTVQALTKLNILVNFVAAIEVEWISHEMLVTRTSQVLSNVNGRPPEDVLGRGRGGHWLPHLTHVLMGATQRRRRVPIRMTQWYRKWSGLLHLCVDLCVSLLHRDILNHIVAHMRRCARLPPAGQVDAFVEWAAMVVQAIERVLPGLSEGMTLDLLVDEIVTCIYEDDPEFEGIPRATLDVVRRLLRNTSLLGLQGFCDQLQQCAGAMAPPIDNNIHGSAAAPFNGRWRCVSLSERASSPAVTTSFDVSSGLGGLSAFAAIHLLTGADSFELRLSTTATRMHVRTGWTIFPELWSQLLIDGQWHVLEHLPNGLTPRFFREAMGPGSLHIDYCTAMRPMDDGATALDVDVSSYALDGPSYYLRMTLVPVDRYADGHVRQLHVHVQLYQARLDVQGIQANELALWTPDDRRRQVAFSEMILEMTGFYEPY